MAKIDLSVGIGGAAGQGIATPGDILARIFVRRGLHLKAYNAYQSIIRGGHIFLTLRTSDQPVLSQSDKIGPGAAADGVQLCPFSVKELAPQMKGDLVQNTIAVAAFLRLVGVEFKVLEDILTVQFKRKGESVIAENVGVARAGYDYADAHFQPFPYALPDTGKRLAFFEG